MTAMTFTAEMPFTVLDVAALADRFDREAAAIARQHADAAHMTYVVATLYVGLLPEAPATLSRIAEYVAEAEAAAHHTETGAREYPEQFDNLASAAKYAARMAAADLDRMVAALADLDAATAA